MPWRRQQVLLSAAMTAIGGLLLVSPPPVTETQEFQGSSQEQSGASVLAQVAAPTPDPLGDALGSVLKAWRAVDPRERQELARQALDLLDRQSAQAQVLREGSISQAAAAPGGPVVQRAELTGVHKELRGEHGNVQAFWSPRHEAASRLFMRAWLEDAQGRRGQAWDQVQRDRLQALRYGFLFGQRGFLPVMARTLTGNEPLKRSGKSRPGSLDLLSVKVCGPNFTDSRLEEMDREVLPALGPASLPGQRWAAVGAGLGPEAVWISELTGTPCDTQDLEPTLARFWAYCEARLPALQGRKHIQGTQTDCRLDPASYDGVLMCEVLHCLYAEHNPEPVRQDTLAWLRSVRAALRPGGRLVVTEKADTYKTLEVPAQLLREAGFSGVEAHEDGLRFMVATVAR